MTKDDIKMEYFEWLYDFVSNRRYVGEITYRRLLKSLHDTEFRHIILKDENRAIDGASLRNKFAIEKYTPLTVDTVTDILSGPCSVLEMMIALAIRCEDIMDDPSIGNRTGQWFWKMISNLGLGGMYDTKFDQIYVDRVISIFLERKYEPDGSGGLFKINKSKRDLRKFEIWIQMLWYLDMMV